MCVCVRALSNATIFRVLQVRKTVYTFLLPCDFYVIYFVSVCVYLTTWNVVVANRVNFQSINQSAKVKSARLSICLIWCVAEFYMKIDHANSFCSNLLHRDLRHAIDSHSDGASRRACRIF